MKKLTVMLLIAAMVLGVSACGNSANKENTATESQMSTQEAEDLDAKINELTQKENSILENHKALWEKVFNSIDKSTVEDADSYRNGSTLCRCAVNRFSRTALSLSFLAARRRSSYR